MHRNVQVRFGGGVTANPSGRTYPTLQFQFLQCKNFKIKALYLQGFFVSKYSLFIWHAFLQPFDSAAS